MLPSSQSSPHKCLDNTRNMFWNILQKISSSDKLYIYEIVLISHYHAFFARSDLIMADISMVGDPSLSPFSGKMLWDRDFVKRPFSFESFVSLHERMSVFSWKEYWECSISSYLSLQPLLFSQGFHIWQEIDEDFFIHQMCTELILWSIGLVLTFSSQSAPCEDTPCLVGDNLVTRNIKIINMNLRYEYKVRGQWKADWRYILYISWEVWPVGWLGRVGRIVHLFLELCWDCLWEQPWVYWLLLDHSGKKYIIKKLIFMF